MNNQLVSDADIEKALDYLRDTAVSAAESKAARVYLEEYRKCLKAMIMQEHNQLPVSAQEREAYADQRYLDHLNGLREAVKQDEQNKFLRHAADAKIEAWRPMNANYRSMKI